MINIDGAQGEGGGQIIRTALAMSMLTRQPVHLSNIRARRSRPGLQRQHLVAVLAAAEVGGAKVSGAELGSQELRFFPGSITPGDYRFDIGTAGSTTLVLQTLLPPLMVADAPSRLEITGGTHNPMAPSTGYLQHAFAPMLSKFGPRLKISAQPLGFYPQGGGKLTASIEPTQSLNHVEIINRGAIILRRAVAYCAHLPASIGERELQHVRAQLRWYDAAVELQTVVLSDTRGPGNALEITIASENAAEVVVALGERGKSAETVAEEAVNAARTYIDAEVPVGEHLADQLLIPLALAGGGTFVTMPLSLHATTNMRTIERFLPVKFMTRELAPGRRLVEVAKADP